MQKILIVNNDYQYMQKIYNKINSSITLSVKIIGICNNEKDAIKYIANDNIDILILELDKINTKRIIEQVKIIDRTIKIIIISEKLDYIINIINNNVNIYQFFIKPLNIDKLLNVLYNLSKSYENLENNFKYLLKDFNFNKNSKGYSYILQCLIFCIKNNYTSIYSIKTLYKEIELKNKKSINSSQLEWNISKAIQSMNYYTSPNIINRYFPYNTSPSPKVFLNEILNIYHKYSKGE